LQNAHESAILDVPVGRVGVQRRPIMLSLMYNPGDTGTLTCDGISLQNFPASDLGFAPSQPVLDARLALWQQQRSDPAAPVVVMVHGFQYDPRQPATPGSDNPLETVYGIPPTPPQHNLTWLPLVGECTNDGAPGIDRAVAFTYPSESGTVEFGNAGWSNLYQYAVFDQAPLAARALAAILDGLGSVTGDVRVLAHSLGTRTTCQAVRLLRARMPAALKRIVMLDGAEFCVDAAASFFGCGFDVLNIVNRTDTVLRLGAEQMCHPFRENNSLAACVIGFEGLGGNDRWLDLQLDSDTLRSWLAAGLAPDGERYAIDPRADEESHPYAGLDHWACYTNDGNRALVRDLLLHELMTVDRLRALGVPGGTNSVVYDRFNGVSIPPTPATRTERQRAAAQAALNSVGGSG
jgi:hypothetical protein